MNLVLVRQPPAGRAGWLSVAVWAPAVIAIGLALALPDPLQLVIGTGALAAISLAFVQPLLHATNEVR